MSRINVFIPAPYSSYRFQVRPILFTPLPENTRLRKIGSKLSKQARMRLEWMLWYADHGKNALLTARHFGIAPKTFWKWKKRFNKENIVSLEEHSRAPLKRRHREITQQQEEKILALRQSNIRYGKMKIAALYALQFGEKISSWKVQKVIEKYHLYYHPTKQARINRKRHLSVKRKKLPTCV